MIKPISRVLTVLFYGVLMLIGSGVLMAILGTDLAHSTITSLSPFLAFARGIILFLTMCALFKILTRYNKHKDWRIWVITIIFLSVFIASEYKVWLG